MEVVVERIEGKFASREEIAEQLIEALTDANPGTVEGEAGGEYDVTDFEVTEQPQEPRRRPASARSGGAQRGDPPC